MNKPDTLSHYETQARAALYPELLEVCKTALAHTDELRDAWQRGAITENDGHGGRRSNRNVEVNVALRALLSRLPAERDKEST